MSIELAIRRSTFNVAAAKWKKAVSDFAKSGHHIQNNMISVAKMRGFKPWPCRVIQSESKQNSHFVEFFPRKDKATISSKNVVPFGYAIDCLKEYVKAITLDTEGFVKGVREAELLCRIPHH